MKNIIKEIQESGLFDENWYVNHYHDVKKSKLEPVVHYLQFGWRLGRDPSIMGLATLREHQD